MKEEISTYQLAIYEPDSEFCHSQFCQKMPYPRISKGDYLRFDDTGEKVIVCEVEHAVWVNENADSGDIAHRFRGIPHSQER